MNTIIIRLFFPIGLALSTTSAFADEDLTLLYGDEESVSIATGSSKPIHLAPSVASVITAEDIRSTGATSLDEILESVPGLHVSKSFNRLNSIYSIRGIHTGQNAQVLMLLNGVPVNQLFTGGRAPTFRLPVESIARVEIIRGPGSSVYGADAFAGVINVITKNAGDLNGSHFGLRAGSFDRKDLWAQYGGKLGSWDVAVSLESNRSDGDDDRTINADLQSTLDAGFATNASLAPGSLDTRYDILNTSIKIANGNWNLGLWNWHQDDAGLGPGGAQTLDHRGGQDIDQYLVNLDYSNLEYSANWGVKASINYQYLKDEARFNLFPPGTVLPIGANGNIDFATPAGIVSFPDGFIGNPGGVDKTIEAQFAVFYTGFDRHRIRLSSGYKHQQLETTETKNFGPGVIDGTVTPIDGTLTRVTDTPFVFAKNQDREIWHLSIQDEWGFAADWELTAGIRYDDYSDFGGTINPRLALVWATDRSLTTKLLYGRAFRAPSFGEEFAINNPVILGNRQLDPETIDTVELAFDYRPNLAIKTGLNLFWYEIEDLIEYVPDALPATSNTARNAKNQQGYGFELEAEWRKGDQLRLRSNYAWQQSKGKQNHDTIADAPGQQLYLDALWNLSHLWSLNARLNWVGDRTRASVDTRDDINDYTLVHLTARRKLIAKHWELAASIRNIFDEDAREPSSGMIQKDYPLEGRSIFAELRYSLHSLE